MSDKTRSRIWIDGYNLSLAQGTGIATYARNLSHQAHELGFTVDLLYGLPEFPSEPILQEIAFYSSRPTLNHPAGKLARYLRSIRSGRRPFTPRPIELRNQVVTTGLAGRLPYFDRVVSFPSLFEVAETRFSLRNRIETVRPDFPVDIAHLTYPLPIRIEGAKNICTIHDLIPLRLPYTTLGNKSRLLKLFRTVAQSFDHIVTVSECSKRDIVSLLDIPAEKVTNTFQAVEFPKSYLDKSIDQVKGEVEGIYGLNHKDYFLFYGAIEPKKNIARLIEAYCSSGAGKPLVIVGKLGWLYDDDLKLIETVNTSGAGSRRILRLDYLPQSMLVSLIRGARAVLFPSLYEGFGLAVLEAMLLGTPVLTSTVSALPEVAGDAALLVDPYNIAEMAAGIRRLADDETACAELSVRGRAQAALFSPSLYRERLGSVYDRVLGRGATH